LSRGKESQQQHGYLLQLQPVLVSDHPMMQRKFIIIPSKNKGEK
jgi:hypothetical protein